MRSLWESQSAVQSRAKQLERLIARRYRRVQRARIARKAQFRGDSEGPRVTRGDYQPAVLLERHRPKHLKADVLLLDPQALAG